MEHHHTPPVQMQSLGRSEVRILGAPITKWGAGRARELMQYALLHQHQLLLRETLQERLWPLADPASSSLRVAAHTVRKLLDPVGSVRLESRPSGYQLTAAPGCVQVDADKFGQACVAARDHLAGGERRAALSRYEEAMDWYHGDLLPDCDSLWVAPLRQRFRCWALDGLSHLYREALDRRDEDRLLRWSQDTLQIDPYNERCYRSVVTIHGLRREHDEVQRWIQVCTSRLAEIGRFAAPETVRVMQQVGAAGVTG